MVRKEIFICSQCVCGVPKEPSLSFLQALKFKGDYIEWYEFENPFKTIIDGLSGFGKILIPKPKEKIKMNEGESPGI